MPIHWGAFQLANHPWDDPAERFVQAAENEDKIITPEIGETVNMENYIDYTERWWRKIN